MYKKHIYHHPIGLELWPKNFELTLHTIISLNKYIFEFIDAELFKERIKISLTPT